MQLFYHSSHLLCARVPFFSDHSALGEFYAELDGEYDSIAERVIGSIDPNMLHLPTISAGVSAKLQGLPSVEAKENSQFFEVALSLETELRSDIDELIKSGVSEGTRQLLGDISDSSEKRCYKIKQRLKK